MRHCSDESCACAVLVLGISASCIISRHFLGSKPGYVAAYSRCYRRGSIAHRRSSSSATPALPHQTSVCNARVARNLPRCLRARSNTSSNRPSAGPFATAHTSSPNRRTAPRARCHLIASLPKPGFGGWQAAVRCDAATPSVPPFPFPPTQPATLSLGNHNRRIPRALGYNSTALSTVSVAEARDFFTFSLICR